MSTSSENSVGCAFPGLYMLFGIVAAKVGYTIHHSIFWAIVDFFFPFFATIKWLLCEEINMSIIKSAFSFFFN
jgi:hypothetical protein